MLNVFKVEFVFILGLVVLASCANNSNVNSAIAGLKTKSDISENISVFSKETSKSKNYLNYQQELGRINFILNKPQDSINNFNNVIKIYGMQEEEGALGVGKTSRSLAASTVLDDNALVYKGSDFERAMAHFYNALSYAKLNKLDSSLIEIRASYDVQRYAESKREKVVNSAYSKLNNYSLSKEASQALQESNNAVSNTKNKFLNSYLYYTAGLIREAKGELNSALIDYKNALELFPSNSFLIKHTLRLAALYDYSYYTTLAQSNKDVTFLKQQQYNTQTTVHLIYEQGFVPQKQATKFTVLIGENIVSFALPSYGAPENKSAVVNITVNNSNAKAEVIGNMYNLAKFNLSENYPGIMLRQLTRIASKTAIQSTASNQNSHLGLAAYVLSAGASLFEQADLRGFYTLPSLIQTATINTVDKVSEVKISINNAGKNITIPINNNILPEHIFIIVIDTGNSLYYEVLLRTQKF